MHPNASVWSMSEMENFAKEYPEHKATRLRVISEKRLEFLPSSAKKEEVLRYAKILEEAGLNSEQWLLQRNRKKTAKKAEEANGSEMAQLAQP